MNREGLRLQVADSLIRGLVHLTLVGFPVASSGIALAQADRTGTGSGPPSTQTAPNTTATGVTRPPSRDASPTWRDDPGHRTRGEREMDRIDTGICDGCAPE